jgi:hypothetical protein
MRDEELMLLEQLTYLDDNVQEELEIDLSDCDSVETMVNQFTPTVMKKLSGKGYVGDCYIEKRELAAVINAIKNNKNLMGYKLEQHKSKSGKKIESIVFTKPNKDKNGKKKAIVAFRGTLDGYDWKDNLLGLFLADTKEQKRALRFINSLPYDEIITVGHSKGGNKAIYTAILSNKVGRCVAMDAQGESLEFIKKYGPQIAKKAKNIVNYSLSTDYVHILLNTIPGIKEVYCKARFMAPLAFHAPTALLSFGKTADGKYVKMSNGIPALDITDETTVMKGMKGFTMFLGNTMPQKERQEMGEFLGVLVGLMLGSDDIAFEYKGKIYKKTAFNEINILTANIENLAKVVAYMKKYAEANPSFYVVYKQVDDFIDRNIFNPTDPEEWYSGTLLQGIWKILYSVKLKDYIATVGRHTGRVGSFLTFGALVDAEYERIKDCDASASANTLPSYSDKIYDFSKETYEDICEVMDQISRVYFESVSGWRKNATEEWYEELDIDVYAKGIDAYIEDLFWINQQAKLKVEDVYTKEWEIDKTYASKIKDIRARVRDANMKVMNVSSRIAITQ